VQDVTKPYKKINKNKKLKKKGENVVHLDTIYCGYK
jgi:hypothetical protein